jgi:F-type H+-transporting ATPase subunit b
MRFVSLTCWLLLSVSVFAGVPGCSKTEEKQKGEVLYKGKVIGKEGMPVEQNFNLSKSEDKENLTQMFQEGKVMEIALEKEVNPLELKWDLGLWTLVVFALLYFFLKKLVWAPMLSGLQKREDNIHSAVQDAQKARDEAQRLRDQLQREVDHAQEKVRDILDEGRKHAQQTTDEMVAKARSEIQTERDRLRREIEMARDQALQELWKRTADLATMVSAKAIRRQLTPEDHRRLVDEALTELQGAGKSAKG